MNNRQLYLSWLRTVAPNIYVSAVRRATGQGKSLGGLSSDLVQQALAPNLSHSFLGDDLPVIDVTAISADQPVTTNFSFDTTAIPFDSSSVPMPSQVAIDSSVVASATANTPAATSTFANILSAVAAIGAGVANASTQSKLIQLNTQRAALGLPPVNAAGQVISPVVTSATGAALLNFEKSIAGAGGAISPLLIFGVLGLGAFLLLKKG